MLRLTKVPIGLRGHAPSNQRMDPMGAAGGLRGGLAQPPVVS